MQCKEKPRSTESNQGACFAFLRSCATAAAVVLHDSARRTRHDTTRIVQQQQQWHSSRTSVFSPFKVAVQIYSSSPLSSSGRLVLAYVFKPLSLLLLCHVLHCVFMQFSLAPPSLLSTILLSLPLSHSFSLYYFDFSMYLYWLIYFVPSFLPLLVAVVACRRARAKANLISGSSSPLLLLLLFTF